MAGAGSERDAMAAKLEAERAAREAEEARKREVMAKIQLLEDEISKCQGLITSFNGLKGQVEMIISQVNGCKTMNLEADMNVFSGITASAVNEGIEDARSDMGERTSDFSNVEAAIGTQVGLLESYIVELRSQIRSLRASL